MPKLRAALLLLCFVGFATAAEASVRGSPCLHAAREAAERYDIPQEVLIALTLAETGHRRDGEFQPWPWAINVAGAGAWLPSKALAAQSIVDALQSGTRNIDVGCFQLNHRWHANAFHSLAAMLEPDTNADYAARYLRHNFDVTGDWRLAAARYHSRTPRFQERYLERFDAMLALAAAEFSEISAAPQGPMPFLRRAKPLLRSARPLFGGVQ